MVYITIWSTLLYCLSTLLLYCYILSCHVYPALHVYCLHSMSPDRWEYRLSLSLTLSLSLSLLRGLRNRDTSITRTLYVVRRPISLSLSLLRGLWNRDTSITRTLYVQLNLRVKDTLGLAILSLEGRLSSFWKLKMYCKYTFGDMGNVLCIEVVPFSEGP